MASSVAGARPIDSYFEEIRPELYGAFWERRRIESELRDHLYEAVDRLRLQGLGESDAERRAIEQLGTPTQVARSFARSKGVGVPTRFTRFSGLAMIVGIIVFIAALTYQGFNETFEHSLFAPIATAGGFLVGLGFVGIFVRLRGQLGRWGRTGFRTIFAGVVVTFGSSFLWFMPGVLVGLITMIVGVFMFLVPLWQTNIVPRDALIAALSGVGLGSVAGFVAVMLDSVALGYLAGTLLYGGLVYGLVRLGLMLWSEDPSEPLVADGGDAPAVA